jgi:hypothetical protein
MNAELCDGTQLRRFVEFVKSLSQEVERMTGQPHLAIPQSG